MHELREGDFDAFFEAPFACYGRTTAFISPLKSDLRRALDATKNPLYRDHARRTWFTAHAAGGALVGRRPQIVETNVESGARLCRDDIRRRIADIDAGEFEIRRVEMARRNRDS